MSEDAAPRSGRTRRRRANVRGGRTHRHEVWASDEEEARLYALAQAQGVTIPRLLVERAVAPIGGATTTERREYVAQLYGLRRLLAANSNNLNQLTRAVNSGQPVGELESALLHTLAGIDRLIGQADELLRDEVMRA